MFFGISIRRRFHAQQQIRQRIYGLIVDADFVMKMGTRGPSGESDISDDVTPLDGLPGPDVVSGEVAISCGDAVRLLKNDEIAVVGLSLGENNPSVRWGLYGRAK